MNKSFLAFYCYLYHQSIIPLVFNVLLDTVRKVGTITPVLQYQCKSLFGIRVLVLCTIVTVGNINPTLIAISNF